MTGPPSQWRLGISHPGPGLVSQILSIEYIGERWLDDLVVTHPAGSVTGGYCSKTQLQLSEATISRFGRAPYTIQPKEGIDKSKGIQ